MAAHFAALGYELPASDPAAVAGDHKRIRRLQM
jgi:hypothetical protein